MPASIDGTAKSKRVSQGQLDELKKATAGDGGVALELLARIHEKPANLLMTKGGLVVTSVKKGGILFSSSSPPQSSTYPYSHVLSAVFSDENKTITLSTLSFTNYHLNTIVAELIPPPVEGKPEATHPPEAQETTECSDAAASSPSPHKWVEELMSRAYHDLLDPATRHILVLVNPKSGPGKAEYICNNHVTPILEASKIHHTVIKTSRQLEAQEIAKGLKLEADEQGRKTDTIVIVSGDGLVHEVLNGLANRVDGRKALKEIRLGIIAGGSGNALSVNLRGPKDNKNFNLSALTLVKGKPLPMDLMAVTQGDRKFYTFLSATYGLIADCDLGTEDMRWMGESRFMVGYLRGSLTRRHYSAQLDVKISRSSKVTMWEELSRRIENPTARRESPENVGRQIEASEDEAGLETMPPLRFGTVKDTLPIWSSKESKEGAGNDASSSPNPQETAANDTQAETTDSQTSTHPPTNSSRWMSFDLDVSVFCAGKHPYISSDLVQFPMADPSDGLIDLAIYPKSGTMALLGLVDGAEYGSSFARKELIYYKAEAFRLTPLGNPKLKGSSTHCLSLDGEHSPHEPFQMECQPRLAHVLSMKEDFFLPDTLLRWTKPK